MLPTYPVWSRTSRGRTWVKRERRTDQVSLLYIILIVVIVLLLLGFFTRGRW